MTLRVLPLGLKLTARLPDAPTAQEDESVIKRRKADLQDRPVDILSVPSRPNLPAVEADDTYDSWVLLGGGDDDLNESFYPAPELEEVYEEEPEVRSPAPVGGGVEDSGNVSEELGVPPVVEEEVGRRRKPRR